MSTDNAVYLNHVSTEQLAILCEQKAVEKIVVTEPDVIRSNVLSFGDAIGSITNRATGMYDVRSLYKPESEEYAALSVRLAYCQKYQQDCIDRTKGIIAAPMPAYFYREHDAAQRSELDRRICVSRKPYFMIYRYQDIASQYNTYQKKANMDCQIELGCTIKELLAKDGYTEQEQTFLQWYRSNSPVSLGNCTSNRIARKVEDALGGIKSTWKQKGQTFSYTIYRPTGHQYTTAAFKNVVEILGRYERELKALPAFAKANHMTDAEINEYKASLAEMARIDCYLNCSGSEELAALVLDATYGQGKPSQIPWDLCGDVIIRTLLSRNGNTIHYYEKDPDGEIEYKGEHFTHKTWIMEEESLDCTE